MEEHKSVILKIKDTFQLKSKLLELFRLISLIQTDVESEHLIPFLDSFNEINEEDRRSNCYLLEREVWEYQVKKNNWKWINYTCLNNEGTIQIEHDPISNYIDLKYALLYVGIKLEDIYIEDDLFGNYKLTDTNHHC
ncbi:MAG: hypothetical protein P1U56_01280 [Saprospiraceae bacterium]|nr:hypothetical protein [Saprospiraceae bacterium]